MRKVAQIAMLVVALLATAGVAAAGWSARFEAEADAAQEIPVPVMVDGKAEAEAKFRLSEDGTKVTYKLKIKNLNPVTQAHIHIGAPGQNGGFVVFLANFAPLGSPTGNADKVIVVEGEFTAANLVNAYLGRPLSDLIDQMKAGNTYVNVHTIVNRPGEVRGQIYVKGEHEHEDD